LRCFLATDALIGDHAHVIFSPRKTARKVEIESRPASQRTDLRDHSYEIDIRLNARITIEFKKNDVDKMKWVAEKNSPEQ